jgi:hypothetical protein
MILQGNWQSNVDAQHTSWLASPVSSFIQPRTVYVTVGFYGGVAVNFYLLREGRILRPVTTSSFTPIGTQQDTIGGKKPICVPPSHSLVYAPTATSGNLQLLHLVYNVTDAKIGCAGYTGMFYAVVSKTLSSSRFYSF